MEYMEWITKKMQDIGYNRSHVHKDGDLTIWLNFTDGTDDFNVCYVMKPIDPITIKGLFQNNDNKPILFIVDKSLIMPLEIQANPPLWLRALHAIYYGRIYIWDSYNPDGNIRALHFDWTTGNKMSWSESLDLDGILFTDTDCKLRDFPGVFHIARFYDRAFWKEQPQPKTWNEYAKQQGANYSDTKQEPQKPPKRKKPRSNPNESFWKDEWVRQNNMPPKEEDIFESFRRAFEEQMRRAQASQQQTYNQTPNRYAPTGDKWLQQFIATGSLAAAKTMYRQLSKQFHPDLNPGDMVAEDTFKAISVAFAKARNILR